MNSTKTILVLALLAAAPCFGGKSPKGAKRSPGILAKDSTRKAGTRKKVSWLLEEEIQTPQKIGAVETPSSSTDPPEISFAVLRTNAEYIIRNNIRVMLKGTQVRSLISYESSTSLEKARAILVRYRKDVRHKISNLTIKRGTSTNYFGYRENGSPDPMSVAKALAIIDATCQSSLHD